ncbi:MAG TPA: YkgJ family cysteine cluster protein [Candidatus Methanoperedens sp.]
MDLIKNEVKTEEIEKAIRDLISFPDDRFIKIIREVGFECDRCGKCCTSEFNDHVFLLDEDAERIIKNIGMEFLRPAPYYDFCDNLGRFYVLGYALKNRSGGNCIFYKGTGCEHYEIRPSICRIYPYMLNREADENGVVEWRQIGGLDQHGLYNSDIDDETCKDIVREVKKYELGFLEQKIRFLHAIKELFGKYALKHSRRMYDSKMRDFGKGEKIEVHVFFKGKFVKEIICKQIINPG